MQEEKQVKLKDVRKGDWIALVNGRGDKFPWKVTYIKFQDKQVWDMTLKNARGEKKHFSFLDEEIDVQKMDPPHLSKCPYCGRGE